jgi:hypothetical protein
MLTKVNYWQSTTSKKRLSHLTPQIHKSGTALCAAVGTKQHRGLHPADSALEWYSK